MTTREDMNRWIWRTEYHINYPFAARRDLIRHKIMSKVECLFWCDLLKKHLKAGSTSDWYLYLSEEMRENTWSYREQKKYLASLTEKGFISIKYEEDLYTRPKKKVQPYIQIHAEEVEKALDRLTERADKS